MIHGDIHLKMSSYNYITVFYEPFMNFYILLK